MKKQKPKGQWLRVIKILHGPTLVSRKGKGPPPAQEKAFSIWAKKQRELEERQTNIRFLITYWKPLLQRYLKRKGFSQLGGSAKLIGSKFRPPSPQMAETMKSLLRSEPKNENAKYALRAALNGRTEKQYLFIQDAFDIYPIAYACWGALEWIKNIESALYS